MPNAKPDLKPRIDSLSPAKDNADYVQWCVDRGEPPFFPKGSLYINRTIHVPAKIGARYRTEGGLSYSVGVRTSDHDKWPGNRSRVVNLEKGPIFEIHGYGCYFVDPLEMYGDGESAAIQICSGDFPATGRHRFENISFVNWGIGIEACGDLKDPLKDQHADDWLARFCDFFGGGELFRLNNQQAVNIVAEDCAVRSHESVDKKNGPVTLVNAKRGGNFTALRPLINHQQCRLVELGAYSPNTCQIKILDFKRDRMVTKDHYLELVVKEGDGANQHWDIEISGNIPQHEDYPIDRNRFYRVPSNLPRNLWDDSGVRVRG